MLTITMMASTTSAPIISTTFFHFFIGLFPSRRLIAGLKCRTTINTPQRGQKFLRRVPSAGDGHPRDHLPRSAILPRRDSELGAKAPVENLSAIIVIESSSISNRYRDLTQSIWIRFVGWRVGWKDGPLVGLEAKLRVWKVTGNPTRAW